MEQVETSPVKTITPQALAKRIGISDKRVRALLRSDYPRPEKKKRWEIPMSLARKVEKDYKAREAKKQEQIKKELEGQL